MFTDKQFITLILPWIGITLYQERVESDYISVAYSTGLSHDIYLFGEEFALRWMTIPSTELIYAVLTLMQFGKVHLVYFL